MRTLCLLLCFGCSNAPTGPTPMDSVTFTPTGCTYQVTNPGETQLAIVDDGSLPGGAARAAHVAWMADPSTSAMIVWESDPSVTASRLTFGPSGGAQSSARGFSYAYATDLAGTDPPSVRVHQVHLCGLTPATAYAYSIEGGPSGTFATAPARGATMRFAVAGDSRGNAPEWGKLLAAAAMQGLDFLVYTGDAVDLGSIQSAWDDWLNASASVFPTVPIVFAMGNHEASMRHWFAQFPQAGNSQWFDFDEGDLHFVVLNDSPRDMTTIAGDQAKFLDASLAGSDRKWKLVVHHRAVFSSSVHGSQADLQAAWMPIYDARGVDLVMNGHDHDYERSKTMKGGMPSASGTVYIVNGGGGADLYAAGMTPSTAFSQSTYAYSIVDATPAKLTVSAFSLMNGAPMQIDQVTLSK